VKPYRRCAGVGTVFAIAALAAMVGGWPGVADAQTSAASALGLGPLTAPDEFSRVSEVALERLCTKVCHDANKVFTVRRSSREWMQVLADMSRRGAKGSPDELDLVRRYLTWSFGVVAVNSATAEDLAAVIGLPAEAAEVIVGYRERHGRFGDVNALARVPGIDRAAIEAQIGALRFD
jgi:competence ComEA-like helix-hairpin-helix protein